MTPRGRVLTIVAGAAVLAVAGTVGITLLQTRGESTTAPGAVTRPRPGRPPVFLEFGVRIRNVLEPKAGVRSQPGSR